VLDDFNRKAIRIEIDTSLRAGRLIRVFEQLKQTRGLPRCLRVDNGPEFISQEWQQWCQSHGIEIAYI
jgi:putative transposase